MRKVLFDVARLDAKPNLCTFSYVRLTINPITDMRWCFGIEDSFDRAACMVLTPLGITPRGEYSRVLHKYITYLDTGD